MDDYCYVDCFGYCVDGDVVVCGVDVVGGEYVVVVYVQCVDCFDDCWSVVGYYVYFYQVDVLYVELVCYLGDVFVMCVI